MLYNDFSPVSFATTCTVTITALLSEAQGASCLLSQLLAVWGTGKASMHGGWFAVVSSLNMNTAQSNFRGCLHT